MKNFLLLKEEKVIGEANSLKDFIIICGFGRMGKVLADEFLKVNQKFIIIDKDDETFKHARYSKNIGY